MPVRCHYSLNPGEAIVAEEIVSRYPDVTTFFPQKDIGVDLVVFTNMDPPNRRAVTIQVKESRYFGNSHSWHQVRSKKITDRVDLFVFLTYLPVFTGGSLKWQNEFLVVPTKDLERLARRKKAGKNKVYSFYFAFEDDRVWEVRESRGRSTDAKAGAVDYTRFRDNWVAVQPKASS
jgi:hypothetical protein